MSDATCWWKLWSLTNPDRQISWRIERLSINLKWSFFGTLFVALHYVYLALTKQDLGTTSAKTLSSFKSFYASSTKHLGIGMSVSLFVLTQTKKFGDICWATVKTLKTGQCPGCSRDNCTVQCTVHLYTQLPPKLPTNSFLSKTYFCLLVWFVFIQHLSNFFKMSYIAQTIKHK